MIPRCDCSAAIGWTKWIRGWRRCETCAIRHARRKAGVDTQETRCPPG